VAGALLKIQQKQETPIYMKSNLSSILAPLVFALALPSRAQTTVREETTTTTTNGTLSEFGPQRIVVRTESSATPLNYSVSKTTTYVDETGAPVSMETVRSGLPVTVYYTRNDDALVANKVVVRKRVTTTEPGTTETTTTTTGTVSEFEPERLVIRSTRTSAPVRYRFTKTTTYVDRAGNPVSIKTNKTGLPVTVHYTKVGDEMVAERVVVGTLTEQGVPPSETTRTETTTTTSAGTINEFKSDRLTIRTESTAAPTLYSFSKTTTYVDENGDPVSVETVRSGMPVTVYYTTDGDQRIATKVIVRKSKTETVVPDRLPR
jgi:hypothetical protein